MWKIRSQSKASGSGLCEGDEVVSINGNPCADLTYPQVIRLMESVADSLHMLVKRPSGGIRETLASETENQTPEHLPAEGCMESTTLQIRPATHSQDPEPHLDSHQSGTPLAENSESGPAFSGSKKEEETGQSYAEAPHTPGPPRGRAAEEGVLLERKAAVGWPGPVVELQLSLPQDMGTGPGAPALALLGADTPQSRDPDPNAVHINSAPTSERGEASLRSSKVIQIRRGQELRVVQGAAAGAAGLPRVESNVRAPPPVAYNPIHSPSYPLAAVKSQPSAPQASKTSKKKGKKPLNALDVMKHQPYQLNASLFTFQPPDAKAGLPQRSPTQAASVYSLPAYSPQPAFFPEAASPVSASPVPTGVPVSPKQEVASTAYLVAPRPKFSAKKSGVTAQESGRSLSLPGRPVPPTVSATPAWARRPALRYPAQPAAGPEGAHRRLAPWEAAAESPLGLVEEAFRPRDIRDSVVANVVSAARRKVLPAPMEGWGDGLPHAPQAPMASVGLCGSREYHGAPLPNSSVPTHSQWLHASYRQPSRNDSWMTSLETRSEYCLSAAEGNYNPYPRGWRRPT
ncbi:PREDICTED: synaptopodin-2 [Myotis brandtii]|uniref:synaptopodin-2 n=1 Tax=Myotis brandtii TaxID=109478 RepID=UPI0007046F1D|nr:PREDICTED: synaptopodin-2 [Myotis brandtii]